MWANHRLTLTFVPIICQQKIVFWGIVIPHAFLFSGICIMHHAYAALCILIELLICTRRILPACIKSGFMLVLFMNSPQIPIRRITSLNPLWFRVLGWDSAFSSRKEKTLACHCSQALHSNNTKILIDLFVIAAAMWIVLSIQQIAFLCYPNANIFLYIYIYIYPNRTRASGICANFRRQFIQISRQQVGGGVARLLSIGWPIEIELIWYNCNCLLLATPQFIGVK